MSLKRHLFSLGLLFCVSASVAVAASHPKTKAKVSVPQKKIKTRAPLYHVEPAAIALLDKTAKLYSEAKSLHISWNYNYFNVDEKKNLIEKVTADLTRPSFIRLDMKNADQHINQTNVVDGKFCWKKWMDTVSLFQDFTKKPITADDAEAVALTQLLDVDGSAGGAKGIGEILLGFLIGRHVLSPDQFPDIYNRVVISFEAKKLPQTTYQGVQCHRVRCRTHFKNISGFYEATYWLAADDFRLMAFETRVQAVKSYRNFFEITEQSFNPIFPVEMFQWTPIQKTPPKS